MRNIDLVTTTTRPAKMHATQAAYALARASYEAAVDAFNADAPVAPAADCTDAEFETWNDAEEGCRAKHGLDRLHTLLVAAEAAMVAWAHGHTAAIATAAQRADLEIIHRDGMNHPTIRTKLVNLAFRLAA